MTHSPLYRMRILLALGGACLALPGALHAQAYPHADERIGTIEDVYDGHLTPDLAVSTFRNIDRLFPTRTIPASDSPKALPEAPVDLASMVTYQVDDATYDLYDFLSLDNVTGMIVLKDGTVVFETYQRGNTPDTRWMSMSVAKSITSTLVGAAIVDGHIDGLDDLVVDYVPALAGSAYDGVSIRDILLMASGVEWNETYTDPASDRRDLLRAQIEQRPGAAMEVMAALPRAHEPGTHHTYSTGETQVLGEVVHGAVGKPLADYLAEKIWQLRDGGRRQLVAGQPRRGRDRRKRPVRHPARFRPLRAVLPGGRDDRRQPHPPRRLDGNRRSAARTDRRRDDRLWLHVVAGLDRTVHRRWCLRRDRHPGAEHLHQPRA
ncbi:serine hydrolase, partial [Paracoccus sp. PAMC 22219]|uniref:serine hydrolase domain-containing protein n=1 Tax=Paracoccus sp. PAMC 22219 TaxID=1569209 RepID=UPI0018CF4EEF